MKMFSKEIKALTESVTELCTYVYSADEARRIADQAYVDQVWEAADAIRDKYSAFIVDDAMRRYPRTDAGYQLREALRAAKVPRELWFALRGDEYWPV